MVNNFSSTVFEYIIICICIIKKHNIYLLPFESPITYRLCFTFGYFGFNFLIPLNSHNGQELLKKFYLAYCFGFYIHIK